MRTPVCAEGRLRKACPRACPADHVITSYSVLRGPGRGRPRKKPDSAAADKAYGNSSCRRYSRDRGIRHTIPEKTDSRTARLRKRSRGGRPPGSVTAAVWMPDSCSPRPRAWSQHHVEPAQLGALFPAPAGMVPLATRATPPEPLLPALLAADLWSVNGKNVMNLWVLHEEILADRLREAGYAAQKR